VFFKGISVVFCFAAVEFPFLTGENRISSVEIMFSTGEIQFSSEENRKVT
jgi:hypothetical protein